MALAWPLRVGHHEVVPLEVDAGTDKFHLVQRHPGDQTFAGRDEPDDRSLMRSDLRLVDSRQPVWEPRTLCGTASGRVSDGYRGTGTRRSSTLEPPRAACRSRSQRATRIFREEDSTPPAGPIFERHVASFGLADRLSFYPGDFFSDPLPSADVLVMGHLLHDWSLDEKLLLLRKAYDALPGGGALIVYESIIDDERRSNTFGLLMSLNMLIETQDGFDYTGADCQSWISEVGFRDTYVEALAGPDSMVVGIKPS